MQGSPQHLRRLSLAARAPGLDANGLAAIAALSPDFELLEQRRAHELGGLPIAPQAVAYLLRPDEALIASDVRWLESSDCVLLPSSAPSWLAASMPSASPLVTASPMRAKFAANLRAVARPPAVALRLPTIATWGSPSAATVPRTYSTGGAFGDASSRRG